MSTEKPKGRELEDWVSDPDRIKETVEWIASRPAVVKVAISKCPPWIPCYRMKDNRGHYAIVSYGEPLDDSSSRLTIAHGRDSYLAGIGVFGIDPDDMIPCGCGEFEWPTDEQYEDRRREAERLNEDRRKEEDVH